MLEPSGSDWVADIGIPQKTSRKKDFVVHALERVMEKVGYKFSTKHSKYFYIYLFENSIDAAVL